MTTAETRRLKARTEMGQTILNHALELFSRLGYENVSLHKIAEMLNYTTSALYRYFTGKEEIFYRLYLEGFFLLQKYQARSRHISDPAKRLETHCQDYIKFAFDHREYYDIMFMLRAPIKQLMDRTDWRRVTSRTILTLRQDVEAVLQKKHSDPEVNLVMLMIWSSLHGIISLTIRDRLLPDTKNLRSAIHHLINLLIVSHQPKDDRSFLVADGQTLTTSTMLSGIEVADERANPDAEISTNIIWVDPSGDQMNKELSE